VRPIIGGNRNGFRVRSSSEWNDRKIVKMKKKSKTRARDLANPHEPAPQECAASDVAKNDERSSALRVKISEKKGVPQMHAHIQLMEALGTTDADFMDGILSQLLNAGSRAGKPDERGLNFMLSVVKGVKPRDQVEALLAAQMAAVHAATMTFAFRLGQAETIPQQDSAERAFNKLPGPLRRRWRPSSDTGAEAIKRSGSSTSR
jgi:hypothetical protein